MERKTNLTSFDSELQKFSISKITLWANNLAAMFGDHQLNKTGKWCKHPSSTWEIKGPQVTGKWLDKRECKCEGGSPGLTSGVLA